MRPVLGSTRIMAHGRRARERSGRRRARELRARPEVPSRGELVRHRVDADDVVPERDGTEQRGHPDPTEPGDDHGPAGSGRPASTTAPPVSTALPGAQGSHPSVAQPGHVDLAERVNRAA